MTTIGCVRREQGQEPRRDHEPHHDRCRGPPDPVDDEERKPAVHVAGLHGRADDKDAHEQDPGVRQVRLGKVRRRAQLEEGVERDREKGRQVWAEHAEEPQEDHRQKDGKAPVYLRKVVRVRRRDLNAHQDDERGNGKEGPKDTRVQGHWFWLARCSAFGRMPSSTSRYLDPRGL